MPESLKFSEFRFSDPPPDEVGDEGMKTLCVYASLCPPGCFVEVGVYKGGSAWHLAQVSRKQGRSLHLFDTFTGIPYQGDFDIIPVGRFSDTSLSEVHALIPDACFYPGVFPSTMPDYLRNIAFAHIDCDQYESVRACIEVLWPRMVPGGIMYFDDYFWLDGATKAVNDAFTREQLCPGHMKRVYVVKGGRKNWIADVV